MNLKMNNLGILIDNKTDDASVSIHHNGAD